MNDPLTRPVVVAFDVVEFFLKNKIVHSLNGSFARRVAAEVF